MPRLLERLSVGLALLGGVVLALLAVLVTVSIAGRRFLGQPIPGDVELMQMGTAVAIALFLPYAQLKRAHIIVDFFTARAQPVTRARLDGLGALLAGAACLLLAWRAAVAVLDMRGNGETTMVLGLPIWFIYVAMVVGLAASAVVGLMVGTQQLRRPLAEGSADQTPT